MLLKLPSIWWIAIQVPGRSSPYQETSSIIKWNFFNPLQGSKNNLFIFCSIVTVMYCEDKGADSADKSREFGVLGDVLRELQREEFEEIETCLEDIQETGMNQSTMEIMAEINATLKEIAETQKKILEEIQKSRIL